MSDKITWELVMQFCNELKRLFNVSDRYLVGVYAPPRGGLCLGVIMSHKLGIPLLAAPCDGCLIVDDIADSGETLQHAVNSYDCFVATLAYSRECSFEPDFWKIEKTGEWLVFPWEE